MTQTSGGKQQSAFSYWLRTGRLPSDRAFDGVERKFNPWHDPQDGRFTFAGSGHYYGRGEAKPTDRASETPGRANPQKPGITPSPKAGTQRMEQSERPGSREATGARPKPPASRPEGKPNPAAEFVGGVGEGLYGVAEGTVEAAYSALTTNPVATVRNVGRRIAGMIDTAITAEDRPARIQVSRAAYDARWLKTTGEI